MMGTLSHTGSVLVRRITIWITFKLLLNLRHAVDSTYMYVLNLTGMWTNMNYMQCIIIIVVDCV